MTDTKILISFVAFCNEPSPIELGTLCYTDMSDGIIQKIEGNRVQLWHLYKKYEQWWKIKDITTESNLSRYGIDKCLEIYINNKN